MLVKKRRGHAPYSNGERYISAYSHEEIVLINRSDYDYALRLAMDDLRKFRDFFSGNIPDSGDAAITHQYLLRELRRIADGRDCDDGGQLRLF